MAIYIIVTIIALIIIYLLICYNSFVKLNNQVKEAFSTMDVYLKKRWDLIPNIVESVKGYAEYEKQTIEEIVNLRNDAYEKMNDAAKVEINNKISQGLGKLMAIAEGYPELKVINYQKLKMILLMLENIIMLPLEYLIIK